MEEVQMVSDVQLPSVERQQLEAQARRFSDKHAQLFRFSQLHLHLKSEGSQLAVHLRYLTDRGRYLATSIGWDMRTTLRDALSNLDLQLMRQHDRRVVA